VTTPSSPARSTEYLWVDAVHEFVSAGHSRLVTAHLERTLQTLANALA